MSKRILLLLLCLARVASAQDDEPGLYLHVIPGENRAGERAGNNESAFVELTVEDVEHTLALFRNTTVPLVHREDRVLTLSATPSATASGEVLPAHRQSSFVVDYDEPAVQRRYEELAGLFGEQPDPDQISRFVYHTISNKTYERPFDFASRVAEAGEGDCTEHAVLLAALLRASGYPARVVLGLLLVENGSDFYTFGHAWAEYSDNGKWHLLDATMPQRDMPEAVIRHLPMSPFDNEGPGYAMELIEFAVAVPKRVDLVPAVLTD